MNVCPSEYLKILHYVALERPRRRWEDNIKMDLREIGFGDVIGFIGLRIGTGGGLL
jgi:hypothetical protein